MALEIGSLKFRIESISCLSNNSKPALVLLFQYGGVISVPEMGLNLALHMCRQLLYAQEFHIFLVGVGKKVIVCALTVDMMWSQRLF